MSSKVLTRPRLNSEERRASIVEAACKLFSERGFRGTTTRELASAVGVSEPILYEHFKTKRDLYSAIIETKSQEGFAMLEALAERYERLDDDRGFFNELGMGIIAWYVKDPTIVRLLLFSSLEGHELKDLFHESSQACFDIITGYIRRRSEAGILAVKDPQVAGRAFFGMVAHYALSGMLFGCAPIQKPVEQIVAEMVEIFVTGISKEKGK